MRSARVYVPASGAEARLGIDAKSGIVGQPVGTGELVEVYYEGNRYGASNIVTYADRCHHAFGRLSTRYPTIARKVVPASLLQDVGTFTDGHGVDPDDVKGLTAIARWLDLDMYALPHRSALHGEMRLDGGRR